MKKLSLIAFAVVLIVGMFASGCSDESKLVGKWEFVSGDYIYYFGTSSVIEFYKDGTVYEQDNKENGEWEIIEKERLRVKGEFGGTYIFTYDISGNMITLVDGDGDTAIFKKSK